jgi:mono/diheme cytochrome c family protein
MKTRLIIFILLVSTTALAAPPIEEGKTIFSARCAGCHNVNRILTGPALAGVDERHSIDWIINFVHSSQTVIKKGDTTAIALFEKFNRIPMPDHPDLTEKNIKDIVEFIRSEAKAAVTSAAPFATPSIIQKPYLPISITNYSLFGLYLLAVLLLIGTLLLAVRVVSFREKADREE